ncbi:MAG: SufD family Fe-S cluster assembly protein [Puniceicoccales bacterium]|nr:SufD family Fe-S cluster assembly protein [Puniceicoccales bacterium]
MQTNKTPHNQMVSKYQNSPLYGEQQVYLWEGVTNLDISENSQAYLQLYPRSKDCKFICTLLRNSQAKVFVYLYKLDNYQVKLEFNLHDNSEIETVCFVEKCQNLRLSQCIVLLGKHSTAIVRNACKTYGKEKIDIQTSQTHSAPRSISSIETNSVLDGCANINVSGVINVLESSHESTSDQYTKAITLSDDARVIMSPFLNILTNDIVCKHGAASGGLDELTLLYAQSRGISPAKSKEMLADGFIFSCFDNLKHPFWETHLTRVKENS